MRILAERRAGKYLADLYSGVMGGAAFYEFYRTGVLDSIKSTFILPEVKDGSKWLDGKHHYVDTERIRSFFTRVMLRARASTTTPSR